MKIGATLLAVYLLCVVLVVPPVVGRHRAVWRAGLSAGVRRLETVAVSLLHPLSKRRPDVHREDRLE